MRKLLNPNWINGSECVCPKGKPYLDVWDTQPEAKGLLLRVSPKAKKTWYFGWTIPGTRKKTQMAMDGKTFPTTTIKDARLWAEHQRARIDAKEDPRVAPVIVPTGDITMSELFDLRFKNVLALDHQNFHKNCLEQQRVMDTDVLPLVGPVLVKDFDHPHLNMVIQPIIDRGSVTQSRRVFEMVRALINYGIEKGYIPYSKIAKAKPTGKEKTGDRALSLAEIRFVLVNVDDILSRSDHVPLITKIAIATGKRSQEIRGATRSEISERKMLWTIDKDRIKGEVGNVEDEKVPLSPYALSLFKEAMRRTNGELLFPCDHGETYIDAGVISHALGRATDRFGFKHPKTGEPIGLKLKDLRATVGTQVLNRKNGLGITRFEKYLMLNHLSAIYANVSDKNYDQNDYIDEKRDAMNKWGAFLERLIAGEIDVTDGEEEETDMQVAA